MDWNKFNELQYKFLTCWNDYLQSHTAESARSMNNALKEFKDFCRQEELSEL